MNLTQLTGPICQTAEGPVWSEQWGGLYWLDIPAGDVLRFDAQGNPERWSVGPLVAAVRPRTSGGVVLALERGFGFAAGWGESITDYRELWTSTDRRFNEGGTAPDGSFYCGSTAIDYRAGLGELYQLRADGATELILDGLGVSNGLAWSPDSSIAYYADTLTGRVDVFDWDPANGLHNRRPFVGIAQADGMPDGLAVDVDGCVWVALYRGGAVRRYRPDGRLDDVLTLPVLGATACGFGGPDLRTLFVTTTAGDATADEASSAGALFSVDVGVAGLPIRAYAG